MIDERKTISAGLLMLAWVLALAACSSEPAVQKETSEEVPASEAGSVSTVGEAAAPAGEAATDAASGAAPAAATGSVLQSQEVDATPGLVAELTEATRKEGVLTVKVRFRNSGTEDNVYHGFETGHGDYSRFYVTAGDQKYFVLKDSEGAPLAPKYLDVNLDAGQTSTWWAKFPAPPASETTFDLIMPDVTPFEDVPIRDA